MAHCYTHKTICCEKYTRKTNRHRDYLYAMPAYNIIQMLQDGAGIYKKNNNAMDIKPLAAR